MEINRNMIFAVLQVTVLAPVLVRASNRESNAYFKWGMRAAAGAVVFANMYHAGKALQAVATLARPSIPWTDIKANLNPVRSGPVATEGEYIPRA